MADVLNFDDPLKELQAEWSRLAKRADQRLVRMEKAGKTTGSAYKAGRRSIESFNPGAKRFNAKKPENVREARARINAVKSFLADETSTQTGIKSVMKRTAGTIEKRYGLKLTTPSQVKAVFEGALFQKLMAKHIGSPKVVRILAAIQRSKGDMKKAFQDLDQQNVYLSTNTKKSISAIVGAQKRFHGIEYMYPGD